MKSVREVGREEKQGGNKRNKERGRDGGHIRKHVKQLTHEGGKLAKGDQINR